MNLRLTFHKTPNSLSMLMPLIVLLMTINMTNLAAEERYRVKPSDNLHRIVSRHYLNSQYSKSQLMVAILERNPRAFKSGNINVLMRGRRLVLPDEVDLKIVSNDTAKAILSKHLRYYRSGLSIKNEGLLDELSASGYNLSSSDLELLTNQNIDQQVKLNKLEQTRKKLKDQLEKLKEEKLNSDQLLEELATKLERSAELNEGLNSELAKSRKDQQRVSNVISDGNKDINELQDNKISNETEQKILENQVVERTQKLKDANQFLQKKLQQTKSQLAENTRENIILQREVGNLKQQQETATSVAMDVGAAKKTNVSLDDELQQDANSPQTGLSKIVWLIPILALFAGLWFLLRFILGGKKLFRSTKEGDTYATPAFETVGKNSSSVTASNDPVDGNFLNPEYEEASLETSIKLDVARAYIEADDRQAAYEMLQEVMDEGSEEQKQEAQDILENYKVS